MKQIYILNLDNSEVDIIQLSNEQANKIASELKDEKYTISEFFTKLGYDFEWINYLFVNNEINKYRITNDKLVKIED